MADNNAKFSRAKNTQNDEFYTQLTDVSKGMKNYKKFFKNKIILCNCDNPRHSAFWKYFHLNFEALGLKKLVSAHYNQVETTYKMEYTGGNDNDIEDGVKTPFKGNGDFRNDESVELLKEADIVVTNPPFSLLREYIAQLIKYDKKFLIIGTQNALTYKEIFPLIRDNKIWWSASGCIRWFIIPNYIDKKYKLNDNGERVAEGDRSRWWTNIGYKGRCEKLMLCKKYTPEKYPKYDNYDVINVSHVDDIPCDYNGAMGVPITFFDKYNPEQFELLDARDYALNDKQKNKNTFLIKDIDSAINGKPVYARIVIRKKDNE